MLVLSARSREMTLARLITMGLGRDQSRRITAVETVPVILAAAVGGTVCALIAGAAGRAGGGPRGLHRHAGDRAAAGRPGGPRRRRGRAAGSSAALTLTVQDALARRLGTGPGAAGGRMSRPGEERMTSTRRPAPAGARRSPPRPGSASSAPRRKTPAPPTAKAH